MKINPPLPAAGILLFLFLAGCAPDHAADLSRLSNEDAELYCEARVEWGLECDDEGTNVVKYDPAIAPANGRFTIVPSGRWTIKLNPDAPCMYKTIRHEIGHLLGYIEGGHPWVVLEPCLSHKV